MLNMIRVLFLKEITETRRDKRSLITVVFLSLVMPLSILASLYFSNMMKEKADTLEYQVEGAAFAPALVGFLNSQGFKTTEADNGGSVKLIIPDDYRDKIARGYLPTLTIRADISGNPEAYRKLERSLEVYGQEIATSRLVARGVSPIVMRPFMITTQDTGEVSFLARFMAPGLIFMFLVTPIYALMPAGIDCTAGERERHGLFPLLLQPIPAIVIPLSKLLMLLVSGMLAFLIAISSGFVAYSNVSIEGMNFGFDFSFFNLVAITVMAIPTVAMLAALIMGFASFAKSFKEGQTYVGMAAFLPVLFIGSGFVFGEDWQPYIPFWAEATIFSGFLTGETQDFGPWLLLVLIYSVIVCFCMWWMSRSIQRQALSSS